ncbi:toxin-antitoxin system HicB family antitoxin [Pontibacter burrus]|uniref:Toxin-antitoxin system HicB family antitoxin n=1 Tax=Pontibacter burrus TaxID=2704466 RepID=A0A6B3LRG5_9BACT|nr:toxin-antitoxin system HicB family antitoxin [Pontibacter burrus]NEM96157.1 toxin-antitoxin system HicB family antitoxin [Pontibacter burrus]
MMSDNNACKPKEPRVQIRLLPQLERELSERAREQGQTLNAFLRPFLYAIARKEMRMEAVVSVEKLLPRSKTPVRHG